MMDAALFPIPNAVSFPGVPRPLHVFEPRYRQMVLHCIEADMPIGVCHTEKILHANQREQSLEEALHSNQSTYKPREIFSAGPVELLQELDDGRMLIQVDSDVRLRLVEERQTLPFSIWICEELLDDNCDHEGREAVAQCREKILQRLITLTHGNRELQAALKTGHWQTMPAPAFSFAVAGLLGLDANRAQQLLETTDTRYRLDQVLEIINGAD